MGARPGGSACVSGQAAGQGMLEDDGGARRGPCEALGQTEQDLERERRVVRVLAEGRYNPLSSEPMNLNQLSVTGRVARDWMTRHMLRASSYPMRWPSSEPLHPLATHWVGPPVTARRRGAGILIPSPYSLPSEARNSRIQ
jgi:hypothetical protein